MTNQDIFDQIVETLNTKYPGSHWNLSGITYNGFVWMDDPVTKPTAGDLGL